MIIVFFTVFSHFCTLLLLTTAIVVDYSSKSFFSGLKGGFFDEEFG